MKIFERSSTLIPRGVGRLQFIDFARSIVMTIMAWDHVSNFWNKLHHGGEGILGRAPPFSNLLWFMERFVSHVCAPTFIFLAGTVLAISAAKRIARGESQTSVSLHMIKPGLILLILEAAVVSPAFGTSWMYFGVIACIGVCLIIFSVYRRLPLSIIVTVSLIIVLNHSFLRLDFIPTNTPWGWYARMIIHEPNFEWWPYFGLYPIIPWIGVMGLGWGFGSLLANLDPGRISNLKIPLATIGTASIALFFAVRWMNGYGNLLRRWGNTVIDWLYVSKYPPSLAFLLWTLGQMSLLLALGLEFQNHSWFGKSITGIILSFGRNPLFFYLTHLWLFKMRLPTSLRPEPPPPFYLEMWQTFTFWIVGLVVLWQLCTLYERLKRSHSESLLQYI